MKIFKYLIQFLIISIFFIIFRILGYKIASDFGAFISSFFGPMFRSKKLIKDNIKNSLSKINDIEILKITETMWSNYGRILSDYMFINKFRKSKLDKHLIIDGQEIFEKIKKNKKPVIFISGHFNNFELMAMEIEKSGINLAAIYRPLNNFFLNKLMEHVRKKYICKNQIKKGISGIREMIRHYKNGTSIALMIDQRVSEGISSNLFNRPALTTTIPAQFVKKFDCPIVPVYIERINKYDYKMTVNKPINFSKEETIQSITNNLNNWLEKMIKNQPSQWIWSHNRWK
jgi:Kdo2-lipid IVA lauroyltransferase/acyltransferase